jgi:hypothetical protein
MAGEPWQTHHLVWLLDDDLNELGCVSGMAGWDTDPTTWTAMARPLGTTGNHWWEYTDIGHAESDDTALGLLRQHVLANGGGLDG